MNYLITGGSGLIGKELIKKLLNNGDKVISIDHKPDFFNSKRYKFYKINIEKDNFYLNKCIKKNNIETVIHLAAFLGVKKTEENPEKVVRVNFLGTKNVLESCKNSKVKNFIFSSSSEVYGDQKKKLNEKMQLIPKSFYGFSKFQAELLVKNFCIKNNINYKIVRFFNIYGPGQKKLFVIPKFLNLAKNNNNLKIYGSGNQIRAFCHVEDAVNGVLKVVELSKKNQTFNIGNNNEPIKIIDLAKKIIKITKSKSKIVKIPFSLSDRHNNREIFKRIPNIKKIRLKVGYKPLINLNEGINSLINKN